MIAFFDVDHTLISRTSAEALFIRWFLIHRKLNIKNLFLTGKFFFENLNDLHDTALRRNKMYLRGLSQGEIEKYAEIVFIEKIKKRISTKALQEIQKLKNEGRRIVLLSASFEALITRIKNFVLADDFIATTLEFKDGSATGGVLNHPYGKRKIVAALTYLNALKIPMTACLAYGNATSDIPFLKTVGEAVAVNPSRTLSRVARQYGWRIIYL